MVINDCKRSVIFCDPANKFSAANSFSDIQQTQIYFQYILCFHLGVLVVAVQNLPFANPLKGRGDQPIILINALHIGFDVPRAISCFNSLVAPAYLRMMVQVTGRLGITHI
jgi:hypothetical protein